MIVHALDIGGSSVKRALVDTERPSSPIVERFAPIVLESREFSWLRGEVVRSVRETAGAHPEVATVAVSTTGLVDASGTVVQSGHFRGYAGATWAKILPAECPGLEIVTTTTDGWASAWAEYAASPMKAEVHTHFVIGTGIGGATVVEGRLLPVEDGEAGRPGHIKVTRRDTATCSCGETGCIETVAAAPAIVRGFAEREGHGAEALDFRDVVGAARAGRATALGAIRTAGAWLGVAVGRVIDVLNPRVITVGGGVVAAVEGLGSGSKGNPYVDAAVTSARAHANERAFAAAEIRRARHPIDGGLIGAALLAARTR
jgi:glucokinase